MSRANLERICENAWKLCFRETRASIWNCLLILLDTSAVKEARLQCELRDYNERWFFLRLRRLLASSSGKHSTQERSWRDRRVFSLLHAGNSNSSGRRRACSCRDLLNGKGVWRRILRVSWERTLVLYDPRSRIYDVTRLGLEQVPSCQAGNLLVFPRVWACRVDGLWLWELPVRSIQVCTSTHSRNNNTGGKCRLPRSGDANTRIGDFGWRSLLLEAPGKHELHLWLPLLLVPALQ